MVPTPAFYWTLAGSFYRLLPFVAIIFTTLYRRSHRCRLDWNESLGARRSQTYAPVIAKQSSTEHDGEWPPCSMDDSGRATSEVEERAVTRHLGIEAIDLAAHEG